MSNPFRYYVENANRLFNDQLSFRFAACSRQDPTIFISEDLKEYCNLIDSVIIDYLNAKSIKEKLLKFKNESEIDSLTKDCKEKILKLKEERMRETYNINNKMNKICNFVKQFENNYCDETDQSNYLAKYDNEKKIWKFISK
tara:strand:- start:3025 stop:3450 length:426 start_codon:yes stop_codon:yes gene_type:complete